MNEKYGGVICDLVGHGILFNRPLFMYNLYLVNEAA